LVLTFFALVASVAIVVGASFVLQLEAPWARSATVAAGLVLWVIASAAVLYKYFRFVEQEALRLHELDR
jgi:hypothetical protein